MTNWPAPALDYEDALRREALSIERRGDALRVITVPQFRWRAIPIAFWVSSISLIAIVIPIGEGEYARAEISDAPEDVARVADALAAAVVANRESIDRSLPDRIDNIDALRPAGSKTRAALLTMLCVGIVAVGVGLFIAARTHDFASGFTVTFWMFIVGSMPIGLILGTQKKEYWQ